VQHILVVRTRRSDADADRHPKVTEPGVPVFAARVDQSFSELHGALLVRVWREDRELLAAGSRDHVGETCGLPEDLSNLAQNTVAGEVAVRVVDDFEMIQVQCQYGDLAFLSHASGNFPRRYLVESAGVEALRKRVREDQFGEFFAHFFERDADDRLYIRLTAAVLVK
jgi:hypothetical protein